jgi:hypothetical protein
MTDVSESSKHVARRVAEAFDKRPKITEYWDVDNRFSVAIASGTDVPTEGITSYSTVNLSDWPMYFDGREHETRVEIAGSAPNNVRDFQSALSTAAFCVMNGGWPCRPGVIYPDILAMYHMSMTMKHVLFMEPVVWDKIEESIQLPGRLVTWVMMVPIADSEHEYAKAHGWEALGQIFEDRNVDYWDLQRKPLV